MATEFADDSQIWEIVEMSLTGIVPLLLVPFRDPSIVSGYSGVVLGLAYVALPPRIQPLTIHI